MTDKFTTPGFADITTLSKEAYARAKRRNCRKATVSRQFTKNDAREKLNRHYPHKIS